MRFCAQQRGLGCARPVPAPRPVLTHQRPPNGQRGAFYERTSDRYGSRKGRSATATLSASARSAAVTCLLRSGCSALMMRLWFWRA